MAKWSVRVYWPHASYIMGPFEASDLPSALAQAKAQLRREGNHDMLRWTFSVWLTT